jgi:pyruvate, water dikinase
MLGLRGDNGLETYVMCEIPSNAILAKEFAQRFDGFSIGSNDLTQLILGVDRDSEDLVGLFDEQDTAVKWMIRQVIAAIRGSGEKVGLCGQAPERSPGVRTISGGVRYRLYLGQPDSFMAVKQHIAAAECRRDAITAAAAA